MVGPSNRGFSGQASPVDFPFSVRTGPRHRLAVRQGVGKVGFSQSAVDARGSLGLAASREG